MADDATKEADELNNVTTQHPSTTVPATESAVTIRRDLIAITIVALIVTGALIVLCLALTPRLARGAITFGVFDPTLTEFELSNSTLKYDLGLRMTVENVNTMRKGLTWWLTHVVFYDRIEACAYYGDQRFSTVRLTSFWQIGRRWDSPTENKLVFKGQNLVVLSGTESTRFGMEKEAGVFNIVLEMRLRVWMVLTLFGKYDARIRCEMKVPVTSAAGGAISFKGVDYCDLRYS